MLPLTSGMIQNVAAVQDGMMNDTVLLKRRTQTSDGVGGSRLSWADVASYTCRITTSTTAGEREIADRLQIIFPVVVALPLSVSVLDGDRLYHAASGKSFDVAYVPPVVSMTTVHRVICSGVK